MRTLLLIWFFISGCAKSDSKVSQEPIVLNLEHRSIGIKSDSPFLKHLSAVKIKTASASSLLKEKSSVVGVKEVSAWKFLTDDISILLDPVLKRTDKAKENVILRARLSRELAESLKNNDKVYLATDNFSEAELVATIIHVEKFKNSDLADIYIASYSKDSIDLLDFYWVDFKYKSLQTFLVPIKSVLYISNEEYVLKRISPNEYVPKHISIASHSSDGVIVFGGLQGSDEVLSEGAILLKPMVEQLVAPTYEIQK